MLLFATHLQTDREESALSLGREIRLTVPQEAQLQISSSKFESNLLSLSQTPGVRKEDAFGTVTSAATAHKS